MPEKLTFEIVSNILGTSTKTIDFAQSGTDDKKLPASTFNGNGALDEVALKKIREEFRMPSIRIASINSRGVIVIEFSDDFFQISNVTQLQDVSKINGVERMNLQLTVDPEESQTSEQLKFTWTPLNCTEKTLTLKLKFEQPLMVSSNS